MQLPPYKAITLSYARGQELVNDAHLFAGAVVLHENDTVLSAQPFEQLFYHDMLTLVSRLLRENPDANVTIVRTERPGLRPLMLGEELRVLLRDDPVRAIKSMSAPLGEQITQDVQPVIKSAYDTLADAFGETVLVRVRNGSVEDPLSGRLSMLAAVLRTNEWAIRGEGNRHADWLRIKLPEFVGDMTNGDTLAADLALCRWASVRVEDLLQTQVNRFFLPRKWNKHGQWISRIALQERLQKFVEQRKEAES